MVGSEYKIPVLHDLLGYLKDLNENQWIWKASEDDYPESYLKNCLIYVLNSEKIKYVYYQSGSADLNSIYSLEYDLDDDDDVDGKDLYLLID